MYQLIVYGLLAGFVLVFWKASQWAIASTRAAREADALSPADLMSLKEACEQLISDLRLAADESTSQIESAVRKAETVLEKLETAPQVSRVITQISQDTMAMEPEEEAYQPTPAEQKVVEVAERIFRLADEGYSAPDIARRENRSPGEIKLILDLRSMKAEGKAA